MSETDTTQVLKFTLGAEDYCIGIDYVAEIVDGEGLTTIPESEPHVEGVMDLRGRTTTIVNPQTVLDTDSIEGGDGELLADGGVDQNRIVVLDSETVDADTTTGWVVSDVSEVMEVSESDLEAGGVRETDLLRGLIKEEEGFTLWVDPHELTA
jgi:purine-binding chemotaxis protein CheW